MEFFRLVSSAFARMEKTPIVPNTPIDSNELKTKIRYYAKKLDVINKMNEWTKIHKIIENFERDIEAKKDKIDYYLLNLDLVTKELSITPYKKNEDQLANAEYSRLEQKMIEANEERDIVLVSADTTRELRKGYPNYFMDSKQFLNKLNQYIKDED